MTVRNQNEAFVRRVGILTSGGDAPGMNAAVAAAWSSLAALEIEPVGIAGGFEGLAADARVRADLALVVARRSDPGTWLGTSRWPQLATPEGVDACRAAVERLGLEGLVVIGGNGSAAGARALLDDLPVAFVPATIDRDVAGTALTIGSDSAVAYGVDVVERLRTTGRALAGRAFVVQTLGAPNGYLADAVAEAAGVDHALVPERIADLDAVARHLQDASSHGAVVVMSEAIGDAVSVAAELARLSGLRVHPTILGHAQRAASPTTLDMELATKAGIAAAATLAEGDGAFVGFTAAGRVALTSLASAPLQPQGAS